MAGGTSVELLRDIRILFESGTASGLTDRQLLERFIHHRDPSAFEVLVVAPWADGPARLPQPAPATRTMPRTPSRPRS